MNLIKDSKEHFQYDWEHRRWLFWAEMIGSVAALFGAFGLALFQNEAPFLTVYLIFTVSSVIGMVSANVRQSGWMMLTSTTFTIVNLIGIIKSLL